MGLLGLVNQHLILAIAKMTLRAVEKAGESLPNIFYLLSDFSKRATLPLPGAIQFNTPARLS